MKIQFDIRLILLFSLFFLNSISAQNEKINEILIKSLNAHGGENLNKIKKIKYLKTTFTYDEVGNVKKQIKQIITHKFDPYKTEIESNNFKYLKKTTTFTNNNQIAKEITMLPVIDAEIL